VKKKITCITCPIGCLLEAGYDLTKKEIILLKGNQCKKGHKFAQDELFDPKRILTTTVKINSRFFKRLPVRSNIPAPKGMIEIMVKEIKKLKIALPVKMGEILAKNFMDSGVNIISSTTIEK
jgi:CxxC motif-containing protein